MCPHIYIINNFLNTSTTGIAYILYSIIKNGRQKAVDIVFNATYTLVLGRCMSCVTSLYIYIYRYAHVLFIHINAFSTCMHTCIITHRYLSIQCKVECGYVFMYICKYFGIDV